MSVLHPESDSTLDPRLSETDEVRHGFHVCQWIEATQTARCGYQRPGKPLGSHVPPANACPLCVELRSMPCGLCEATV